MNKTLAEPWPANAPPPSRKGVEDCLIGMLLLIVVPNPVSVFDINKRQRVKMS
ncbi:hypothetical protein ASPCADRAFT_202195 [Aspergillus carbonarius ITEM 5010]|uniref:Uncharacterized protein n=1 Tax=Aspergillus carbonarius (strain ITEM 5010) TaxID=602072 RepID=A0A1R3S0T2_ASPC5|nr:hypothetical protein ASPCADRAFT_202195 [Aspergillus carbonarius ITEM 5010]